MRKESLPLNITVFLYFLIALFPVSFYLAYQLADSVEHNGVVMKDLGSLGGALKVQKLLGSLDESSKPYIESLFQSIEREFMDQEAGKSDYGFQNPQDTFRELYAKWKACDYAPGGVTGGQFNTCQKDYDRFVMSVSTQLQGQKDNALYMLYGLLVVTLVIITIIVYIMRIDISEESDRHAMYDKLTGLYNRNYFLEEIRNSSARASRTLQPLSIIIFGIDDLENVLLDKRDTLLATFGEFLSPLIRSSDIACRIAENQFAVIAPDTEVDKVNILAVRLRKAVEKQRLMDEGPVSISVGGSQYINGEQIDSLIRRAEQKWREAKEFKNRVILDK